jgi:hypothetical protein
VSSAVIDVVVAVFLTFALTALVASAVVEWIGNLTRKRAKYLLRGLRNMLDARGDPVPSGGTRGPMAGAGAEKKLYDQALRRTGSDVGDLHPAGGGIDGGLTALLFDHPLLRSMMQPRQSAAGERMRVPPYVPAGMFSRALIDTLVPADDGPLTLPRVRAAIVALDGSMPARRALLGLTDQARGDLDEFLASLERWYDAQMDRVSGWYKRWAKRWIIVVAAVLCLAANIDAYAIAGTLYRDPALRAAVVSQVQQGENCAATPAGQPRDQATCVRDLVDAMDGTGRALWWPEGCPRSPRACLARPGDGPQDRPGLDDWLLKLLGLAITVGAVAMGAPFWFDALNRLVNLRNTGKRPEPGR